MKKRSPWRAGFAAALLAASLAFATEEPQPDGPEFQVNSYTTGEQANTSVALDPAGNFVVVWNSDDQGGSGWGIFAQRYDSKGSPLGEEFLVNTYTTDGQWDSSVAMDAAGNFVVVWISDGQDGDGRGIFGQRFDSAGVPQGSEFPVNTYTTADQIYPSVAMTASGGFVVVWQGQMFSWDVFGQRFDDAGVPQGDEFRVNTVTADYQRFADVALDGQGNFIVVWGSVTNQKTDVFGQLFEASGVPVGGEFQINTSHPYYSQSQPAVAMDEAGEFVVVWSHYSVSGTYIQGRRLDSAGDPLGDDFRVSSEATYNSSADVASHGAGTFTVVWTASTGGNSRDIRARHFPPSGDSGNDSVVNSYITNRQQFPAIGSNSAGEFVVSWSSYFQDGTRRSIFAQRYDTTTAPDLTSAALCGDTAHYAWARFEEPGGNTNIRYRSCTMGGACTPATTLVAAPTNERRPTLACEGSTVLVAWEDRRDDDLPSIAYRRSTNGGADFSPLAFLARGSYRHTTPALAMSGDVALAVWARDFGYSVHYKRVVYRRSTDGGQTWSPLKLLVRDEMPEHPVVDLDGSRAVVAWEDRRFGNRNIAYRVSDDAGLSFAPLTFAVRAPTDEWTPTVTVQGDNVLLGWVDYRRGKEDVAFRSSLDGGLSFSPLEFLARAPSDDTQPFLANGGGSLFTWVDERSGSPNVSIRSSTDGGSSWSMASRLVNAATVEAGPVCAISGDLATCIWTDTRSGQPLPHARHSMDGGQTWLPPMQLDP